MQTAYHLGVLQRRFSSRKFDENLMENLNEMHFVVNLNNGQILGFQEDIAIKYAEVVSSSESMTMVVRNLVETSCHNRSSNVDFFK